MAVAATAEDEDSKDMDETGDAEIEEDVSGSNTEDQTSTAEDQTVITDEEEAKEDQELPASEEMTGDQDATEQQDADAKDSKAYIQNASKTAVTLEQGVRDPRLIDLKQKLNEIGFDGIKVTNYFGNWTETRVKQFQDNFGLDVTGILDETTINKIDDVYHSPLKVGNRNEAIIPLKEKLNRMGFDNISVTKNFGNWTETRLKQFQRFVGLEANGIADDYTLAKLDEFVETGFQQGDRHSSLTDLKKKLNTIGFGGIKVTDYFGNWTETRVKQFQENYGLNPTGKANGKTLEKLDEIYNSPFQVGNRHDSIIPLKEKLNDMGFDNISVTKNFGNWTETRVKQFQRFVGLKENGIADAFTRTKLDELVENGYKQGDRHQNIIDLKEQLIKTGFDGAPVSNYFEYQTVQRVMDFQDYYGLDVTGTFNRETINKITDILKSPFQQGKRHDDTIELKNSLNKLGFGNIKVTTLFGSFTESQVRKFQDYYGLVVNGIADDRTFQKIDEILNSPFQYGKSHTNVSKLKEQLDTLGFPISESEMEIASDETFYGKALEEKVSEFQSHYGLRVNGIGDDPTLQKIDDTLSSPLQFGKRHEDVIPLKENLIELGYNGIKVTNYFGEWTETRLKQLQEDYNLPVTGIADEVTLTTIDNLLKATRYTKYNLTLQEALNLQMKVSPQTDKHYAYVSKSFITNSKVTATRLNVRSGPGTKHDIVGKLDNGTKVEIIGETGNWYVIEHDDNRQWVNARDEDVKYYLDPNNFINDKKQQFQFLDLSRSSDASKTVLNNYLSGKGILDGKGQAFIDASRNHGVNDVYLMSHAILETGHGTSGLSNGVKVGKNKSGNLVLVTSKNKEDLTNIKTVYNMYGIGAVDSNAYKGGAFRAYNEGWDTPEKAIIGGARFIGNSYIKSGQNTLYKMRWNPDAMANNGYVTHQYATDIGWASKQIYSMYDLYQSIGSYTLYLDVPEYK